MTDENNSSIILATATQVLKMPGMKINRTNFLLETLEVEDSKKALLLEKGPIVFGLFTQKEIRKIARKLCKKRTLFSSTLSFAAGLPGGFAMAATVPADVLQFFAINMKVAQEVAYLYGRKDLWNDDLFDEDAATGEIILFLGVMLGIGGSANAIRHLSGIISKRIATDLPKQKLTKTVWYPIVKKMAGYLGYQVTKETTANGIAKAVPVLGGILSGGITYFTMTKMTDRLCESFDKSIEYTPEEQAKDIKRIKKEMPDVYDAIFREINEKDSTQRTGI